MKQALIVTNLAGFLCFLWDDIKILEEMGYKVSVALNGKLINGSDATEIPILGEKKISYYQIDFDSKNPASTHNLKAYVQMRKVLKQNKYDLIHCHTPIAGIITRLAAHRYRKKGTKVIYTSHGFAFTDQTSKKSWLVYYNIEKLFSKLTDTIITINQEDYKNAKKMFCKKVFYIHGVGVDIKKYYDIEIDKFNYRQTLGIAKDTIMVLSVGELSERKNHQIVIKALGQLEDKEKYTYVICGHAIIKSNVKSTLQHLSDKYGVKLILLGHRKDIPQINHCADIAIIPSVREGLGLAGIEALASGVPVIGSDVQGIRDYIEPNRNGFLCNAFDVTAFATYIKKCTDLNEFELNTMKEYAKESAKKFDIFVSHEERKKIYEEILGGQ